MASQVYQECIAAAICVIYRCQAPLDRLRLVGEVWRCLFLFSCRLFGAGQCCRAPCRRALWTFVWSTPSSTSRARKAWGRIAVAVIAMQSLLWLKVLNLAPQIFQELLTIRTRPCSLQTPSLWPDMGRFPELWAYKPLKTKYFHRISSEDQHLYLVPSLYGKVSYETIFTQRIISGWDLYIWAREQFAYHAACHEHFWLVHRACYSPPPDQPSN